MTLTVDDVLRIRLDRPCFYCDDHIGDTRAGLDRMNNAHGYHADNVLPCCPICNDAKGHLLDWDEFKAAMDYRRDRLGVGVPMWSSLRWRSALRPNR